MAAVSATPIGLIQEPKGSKVKKPPNTVNLSVQVPAVSDLSSSAVAFSQTSARLPAIPLSGTPINSLTTGIKKIISNELEFALNLGISICSRVQYGFNRSVRSLEKAEPNFYSATYTGLGFSSIYLFGTAPKIVAGTVMKDPVLLANSSSDNMLMLAVTTSTFFAIPFCINIIGKLKFLDSRKLALKFKGFEITPADFTKAISMLGVGFSALPALMFSLTKGFLKIAKNKNLIFRKTLEP